MADIFDVVADPTRRTLLAELLLAAGRGGGESSVGELVAATGLSQPTVSKHLKTLREHGLVHVREDGQHRFYRIDTTPLSEVDDWLGGFRPEQDEAPLLLDAISDADDGRVFSAWAGVQVGTRIGRVAAQTAHGARAVISGAQDRIGEAQDFVAERFPGWPKA